MSAAEDEVLRRIEAVRARVRAGQPDPKFAGPIDPYDVREATRDALKGQVETRADVWVAVMEHHGFVWYEPKQLDRLIGPQKYIPQHLAGLVDAFGRPLPNSNLYQLRPNPVGQWRRDRPHPIPMAFTVADLFSLFGHPEAFDVWIRDREAKVRAARAGIVLAR